LFFSHTIVDSEGIFRILGGWAFGYLFAIEKVQGYLQLIDGSWGSEGELLGAEN